jgi:2-phospho-L-lactate transferase/gluconeogenesis factor (CofD/UPF0052 family)
MLGPSDIRKNIGRLMPATDRSHSALQAVSDYRLPVGIRPAEALPMLQAIAARHPENLPEKLRRHWEELTVRQATGLGNFCAAFLQYVEQQAALGRHFDFTDCALGNIYFAGCYLTNGRDFNRTVEEFSRHYQVDCEVLNITQGENLFLIAEKDDGQFFLSEADLVSAPATIRRICLVEESAYRNQIQNAEWNGERLRPVIEASERIPELNPRAAAALQAADLVIYGPGTQHSSLLPSYLTRGVGRLIAANKTADKVFITNVRRDVDIQTDDAAEIAGKLLEALGRGSGALGRLRYPVLYSTSGWRRLRLRSFRQRNLSLPARNRGNAGLGMGQRRTLRRLCSR